MGATKRGLPTARRTKEVKLAIATEGKCVSKHFGKCEMFTIYEIIEGQVISKDVLDTSQHLQGELVPYLKSQGVNVILTGSMGSGAKDKVDQLKLLAYSDIEGELEQVVVDYLSGKLTSDKPTHCGGCCGGCRAEQE